MGINLSLYYSRFVSEKQDAGSLFEQGAEARQNRNIDKIKIIGIIIFFNFGKLWSSV